MAISDVHPVPGRVMKDIFESYCRRATPYTGAVRYPGVLPVNNNLLYAVLYFVYHLLFGFVIDLLLRLLGRKPRLIRVYRKIAAASDAVGVFIRRRFYFKTNNFWKLQVLMHPNDVADFDFDLDSLDPRKDCKNQMIGIFEYAFKEKFDREKGLRHIDRLFWAEMVIYILLIFLTFYVLKQTYFVK